VTSYKKGQIFRYLDTSATTNTLCANLTTGSQGGLVTYTVKGGNGIYSDATGSVTSTFTNKVIFAPGIPPASLGIFGGSTFTTSGSVTD